MRRPTPSPSSRTLDPERRRRRRRRWRRRLAAVSGILTLLIILAVWTVTRSWFLVWQIRPELERRIGGKIQIAEASYEGDGRLVVRDLLVLAPDLRGHASEVLRIGHGVFIVDVDELLHGRVRVREVELDDVVLRASEDARHPGTFNFMTLKPVWSDAELTEPLVMPRVRILGARLEVGAHQGGIFHLTGHRRMIGNMDPQPDDPGWYRFVLREVDEDGQDLGSEGLELIGRWNAETHEHTGRVKGRIELNEDMAGLFPQTARLWWQSMNMKGHIAHTRLEWHVNEPLAAELDLEDVELTLPVDTTGWWARYQDGKVIPTTGRPRMRVRSGRVRVAGDSLELEDLVGELGSSDEGAEVVGLPYAVSLRLGPISDLDWSSGAEWTQRVLEAAPFELTCQIDDFRVMQEDGTAAPVVELPQMVADLLERLRLKSWSLSTQVKVQRSAPAIGLDGAPVPATPWAEGKAFIREAAGAFQRFPYRLENVDAYLEFNNDELAIQYLTGTGSRGADVFMSGRIAPPSRDGAFDIQVRAYDVPLDDRFRDALRPHERRAIEALVSQPALESLQDAGAWLDQDALEEIEAHRQNAGVRLAELHAQHADPDQIDALLLQMLQWDRLLTAGPFPTEGSFDLAVRVVRGIGAEEPVVTTGRIDVDSMSLLYEQFPYPLHIIGGSIDWLPDRLRVAEEGGSPGLAFIGPGGGRGVITGEVLLGRHDGQRSVEPNLTIRLHDEAVNDLMYAAVPLAGGEPGPIVQPGWPGERLNSVARFLRGLGLAGTVDCTGRVGMDADRRVTYDFQVELENGSAQPVGALSAAMGRPITVDADLLTIEGLHGSLHATRDKIQLEHLEGRSGHATIRSQGVVDLRSVPIETSFAVEMGRLDVGPFLLKLAPEDSADPLRELWTRYEPRGEIDVRLQYESLEPDPLELEILPRDLDLTMDGRAVSVRRVGGSLSVNAGQAVFHDLELELAVAGEPDGVIRLGGVFQTGAESARAHLRGAWTGGHFSSPLVAEALGWLGDGEVADQYRAFRPRGTFDATFAHHVQPDLPSPHFEMTLAPHDLSFVMRETPIAMTFSEGSEMRLKPGRVELVNLALEHEGGSGQASGEILFGERIRADVHLDYDGLLMSEPVQVMLPDVVREIFSSVEFQEDEPSLIRRGRLKLVQTDAGQETEDAADDWAVSFSGVVETRSASLVAGLEASQVDGDFEIDLDVDPAATPELAVQANVRRMRLAGHEMTDATFSVLLDEEGQALRVPQGRADVYGGAVSIQGVCGIGKDHQEYDGSIELAGVWLDRFLEVEALKARAEDGDDAGPVAAVPVADAETPSGEIFARLDLSGRRDQPESRCGRGMIRVLNGRLASMPLTLSLIHLFELSPPLSGALDYADVDFFVSGDRVVCEEILLECPTLELIGTGEMTYPTLGLDLTFHSRGKILLVRDLVGSVSDRLFAIAVGGTLRDPEAALIALPAPRDDVVDARPSARAEVTEEP